jgi:hypothetical protein
MPKRRVTVTKRQREQAKRDRQQRKAERRANRAAEGTDSNEPVVEETQEHDDVVSPDLA